MSLIQKPNVGIKLNKDHLLAAGLVGCWVMNEGTGDKVFDLSGNGNDGSFYNSATWKEGGLNFTAANSDCVNLNNKLGAGLSAITVFAIVKPDIANIGGLQSIFEKRASVGLRRHTNEAYSFSIFDAVGETVIYGIPHIDTTQRSVCGVYDGSDMYLYVNAIQEATSNARSGAIRDNRPTWYTHIGARYAGAAGGEQRFDGTIQCLYVWERALTPSEIAQLHREPYAMFQYDMPAWMFYTEVGGVTLTVAELMGAGTLDSFNLSQKHGIAVQELLSGGSLDSIVLTQKHLLALQELLSSGALDNVTLIQKHILSIQELHGAGVVDNAVLTQKHILAVQELLSSEAIDNIDLITAILLVVQKLISNSALHTVNLTQKHLLTVQELLSSGILDNITLSEATLLIVAELISNGTLDNAVLTQKHNLNIAELLSSGVLDTTILTQKHILAVQELLSAVTLDALNLVTATLLVVADLVSEGVLDSNALIQKHILTVQEVLSAGLLDGTVLTQKQLLIIQNLLSSGLIDNINFDIAAGLIYISLSQAVEYDISLSQAVEYGILSSQAVEYGITLSQVGGGIC